uniref:Uncharacterized protein n=1 Tax=Schistosoma japonicum TaxID=6182 RepID=Q5C7Z2_SCHJA|nr:unknown [Schistosoma japonicum]
MIASDHDNFNASRSTLCNCVGHSGSWWINHRAQPNKTQICEGEVRLIYIESITFFICIRW